MRRVLTTLALPLAALGGAACAPDEARPDKPAVVASVDQANRRPGSVLVDAREEPPGANCPNGGVALLRGVDNNRNDLLDPAEVTSTDYVCNGTDGQDGVDGREIILTSRDEPIGTACPTGGTALSWGYDDDRDGTLDADELERTEYVCNGLNGPQGTDGKNGLVVVIPQEPGDRCPTGGVGVYTGLDQDGDGLLQPTEVQSTTFICDGQDGASAAVRQAVESAGANCTYGGTRIQTGLDDDGDGELADAEVDHTSFVCDGAPGPTGPQGLSVLSNLIPEPPGGNCENGGVRLELGADDDRSGVLDPTEVDATEYVCNGASGGASGGVPLQLLVEDVSPQELPLYGGSRHTLWADASGDGQMQEPEIILQVTIARLVRPAAGPGTCPQGQGGLELGLDLDLNGTLDNDEVLELRCVVTELTGVSAGGKHTCALSTEGTARCWGLNYYGELGNGTTTNSLLPTTVSGLADAASISTGNNHTCALSTAGIARCWGNNATVQLGNAETADASLPVVVWELGDVSRISAGGSHTCAVLTDRTARCWGENWYGQLGNGASWPDTAFRSPIPVEVDGLTSVARISAGVNHGCAVLTDGTAHCWGNNSSGQLGDGKSTDSSIPVRVATLAGAVSIAAGGRHTCAMLTDGTARCWGANSDGQLGNGTTQSSALATVVIGSAVKPVSALTGVVSLSAGSDHTCATLADGTARCWGGNSDGQLGDGTTTSSLLPAVVSELTDVARIAAGYSHTCASRSDGSTFCWGNNVYGQLGNGTTTASPVPVAVTPGL